MKKFFILIFTICLLCTCILSVNASELYPFVKISESIDIPIDSIITDFYVNKPLADGKYYCSKIIRNQYNEYRTYISPLILPEFDSLTHTDLNGRLSDTITQYIITNDNSSVYQVPLMSENITSVVYGSHTEVYTTPVLDYLSLYDPDTRELYYSTGIWFEGIIYEDLSYYDEDGVSSFMLEAVQVFDVTTYFNVHIAGELIVFDETEVWYSEYINETTFETDSFNFADFISYEYDLGSTLKARFEGVISVDCQIYEDEDDIVDPSRQVIIGTILELQEASLDGGSFYRNPTGTIEHIYKTVSQNGDGSGSGSSGTITVNSAGVHDVSGYQYVDIQIPPISMYYNGDIQNGFYSQSMTQGGVTASILMDVGNTYNRGTSINIRNNGETNVGRYEFANVNVPQEVIDDVNAFDWMYGAVNGFLQMEILPDFSVGGVLLFAAGFALLIWILKIFLGG